MNIPGFDAESSLGPTMGIYRGKAVFARLGAVEISPAQEFLGSSVRSRNLDLLSLGGATVLTWPIIKRCCGRVDGQLRCRDFPVLPFHDCECLEGPNGELPRGFPGPPKCTPRVFAP